MNKEKLHIIASISLILTIGLVGGYGLGYFRAAHNRFPTIEFVDDINPGIATVKLMKVQSGKLIGRVSGQKTRLAYRSDKIIEVEPGGSFEIPLADINLQSYYQAGDLPENTQFIASKNGKYYYSVFDSRALAIVTQNRIYFSSEKEAEKMGYLKK